MWGKRTLVRIGGGGEVGNREGEGITVRKLGSLFWEKKSLVEGGPEPALSNS